MTHELKMGLDCLTYPKNEKSRKIITSVFLILEKPQTLKLLFNFRYFKI